MQVCRGGQRQGEHDPAEKPPRDVLKDVGCWPTRCYFIVVTPPRCRMGQLLVSSLGPSRLGAGWEPCERSPQAAGQLLLFHSAGRFSQMENPRLESWSPGSKCPAGREELPNPPLAQGPVMLTPLCRDNFMEPTSRDGPGSELVEVRGTEAAKRPWLLSSGDAAWPGAGRAVRPLGGHRPQPCSCRRQRGWAELSFQALN